MKEINEAEIKKQISELLRARYMPLHEQALKVNAMSDDEYAGMVRENIANSRPEFAALFPFDRERVLARRKAGLFSDIAAVDRMVSRELGEVLPFLIRRRVEESVGGPVTDDELLRATAAAQEVKRAGLKKKMQERLASTEDPVRQFRLGKMLEKFEANEPDLLSLRDVKTEEELREVTDRLIDRTKKMFEELREHRRKLSE